MLAPKMRSQQSFPGFESPAATFDQPCEMLSACHERVRRSLRLLARLREHVQAQGADDQGRQAAEDVLRYFSVAAPAHHEDEERHVVPVLQAAEDAQLRRVAELMLLDHACIRSTWRELVPLLQQIVDGTSPALDRFGSAVDRFVRLHEDHLALEDQVAIPAARTHHEAQGPAAVAAMGNEMASRRRADRAAASIKR